MAETDGQEKTEQPTHKRLQDARDKGQVAQSQEIKSLAVFGSGLIMIFLTRGIIGQNFSEFSRSLFTSLDKLDLKSTMLQDYFIKWAIFFFSIITPIILVIIVVSLIANIAQSGFNFSTKSLKPKLNRFNLFSNVKKMLFSSSSFIEVIKSLFKLVIIGLFAYIILCNLVAQSFQLVELSVEDTLSFMLDSAYSMIWKIVLLFTLIAAVDYIYKKVKFKKDMMMTKQEIKEEHKQMEGDPKVKQRIRSQMFKMAFKRMMKDVPKADVIITNPTHYAVALKYDMEKDAAPKLLAKGMDELAQRIKKIAVENNVPLHEDVQLARAIYKACDVGDEIPVKLFKAVAQILAYIFQMKKARKRKSIV
jgi:flagellar biosynthesis protein FlhB